MINVIKWQLQWLMEERQISRSHPYFGMIFSLSWYTLSPDIFNNVDLGQRVYKENDISKVLVWGRDIQIKSTSRHTDILVTIRG